MDKKMCENTYKCCLKTENMYLNSRTKRDIDFKLIILVLLLLFIYINIFKILF